MDIDTNDEERHILNDNNIKQKLSMNILSDYNECDLNAYNFDAPQCKNETVQFHVAMERNDNLSITERYEQLKHQNRKNENINIMKDQYNKICADLERYYSFNAKPFQNTSCTDYASFQLESIRQKLNSEQELKKTNQRSKSIELMEEDGIDNLLNSISDQVQNWSNDK